MTYPGNADTVIVWHRWLDDNTRLGVAQNVVFTPLPFTGTSTPNLTDTAENAWIKTRAWTARPNATSGYFAVPLTASNDPDLTAFPGYRVAPGGEEAFTVAVDVGAPLVSASQQMVTALAALTPPHTVTVGQQVRAVPLTSVALVSPAPSPPSSFFSAQQTTALVLDAVDAHDADPASHPDIRALIGSGGSDGSGTGDQLVGTRTAAAVMSGHRLVTPTASGSVEYADNTTAAHLTRPLWMTLGAAGSGSPVQVLYAGPAADPSWSWLPGPVYLGTAGVLTQTRPAAPAFLVQVGYATTANSMWLERQPSIVLT